MKHVLLSLCRYVNLRLSCCVTLPQTTTKLYITDVTFQESPQGYERLYKFYSEDLHDKRPALQKIIAVALHHELIQFQESSKISPNSNLRGFSKGLKADCHQSKNDSLPRFTKMCS